MTDKKDLAMWDYIICLIRVNKYSLSLGWLFAGYNKIDYLIILVNPSLRFCWLQPVFGWEGEVFTEHDIITDEYCSASLVYYM